ncbi:MAG TPA: N,N-dimethylformamidase beta subunit family domain-containing protein [Pilimelia sp.]|nr:N,N-dimethylformamidase beta subunit family domain-containing protein [Pilimelia sp.]
MRGTIPAGTITGRMVTELGVAAVLALYCDMERVVRPGDRAPVYVSTTARTFRLELYRLGGQPRPVWRGGELPGEPVPAGDPTRDWGWPAYEIEVPADLPGGVYLVVGVELNGPPRPEPSLVGFDGTALLAVTPHRPGSTALYKLPMRTFLAYNAAGGSSLYANAVWRDGACVVGVGRPGTGAGGPTAEPADVYAPGWARQTFWHWDAPFLSWAGRAGYALDVVFDTALDTEPELLSRYGALVTAGHDEYWTAACLELTRDFVTAGGSLAVFGGNTCWWRAEVAGGELRVAKDVNHPGTGDLWWHRGRADSALVGLSYRHGGGSWSAARPASRYRFRLDGDKLLAGVDVDAFAMLPTLAGYEADGHAYEPGRPWRSTGRDGAPSDLVVLAYAPLTDEPPLVWQRESREPDVESPQCATIAYYRRDGSLVFNAGTTDWSRHLDHPGVDRLTRNVLDAIGVTATVTTR